MRQRHMRDGRHLDAYDRLSDARAHALDRMPSIDIVPESAYSAYYSLPKSLITTEKVDELETIFTKLKSQTHPDYLNVAAWAAVEVALIDKERPAVDRVELIHQAESAWETALHTQEQINHTDAYEYMHEDVASYRLALNLAYTPIMKSIVVGNVTPNVREQVFADVLAIAQLAGIQRHLAQQAGSQNTVGDMIGFEHECNAHLTLLYMDDPRYLPLPSTARGGSGYDHPRQTHDLMVVNQHWGTILKIVPIEVKSKASLNDLKRYEALIVRGKMHLATLGYYSPEHTREALANMYGNEAGSRDAAIAEKVTATMKDLLRLYQRGERQRSETQSPTRYHDTSMLVREHPEFSFDRMRRY